MNNEANVGKVADGFICVPKSDYDRLLAIEKAAREYKRSKEAIPPHDKEIYGAQEAWKLAGIDAAYDNLLAALSAAPDVCVWTHDTSQKPQAIGLAVWATGCGRHIEQSRPMTGQLCDCGKRIEVKESNP